MSGGEVEDPEAGKHTLSPGPGGRLERAICRLGAIWSIMLRMESRDIDFAPTRTAPTHALRAGLRTFARALFNLILSVVVVVVVLPDRPAAA